MPYDTLKELPESVRNVLPKHAQEIYQSAFNSAWEQYDKPSERRGGSSREETAHAVAWAAVKKTYEKGPDDKWHKKEEVGAGR
ncbi:MAG: putative cation transport regulator ChaB [Trueperaceae bacterium]|nr:putative cation transport regulator ChaB [Trueperaceae bacterium]MCW5818811.1 putative cation transport regulator ChaB [Trueperaceae bacterium]